MPACIHAPFEVIFLGTSGGFMIPSFHCPCERCQEARQSPAKARTRASVLVRGVETILIDASADMALQLERESIRQIDRMFITHWHYDHIQGLPDLLMPAKFGGWKPVELYFPSQMAHHFDEDLDYLNGIVQLHPVEPGDCLELPDGRWEVVKTTHTPESIGFIFGKKERLAYLVDGVVPPLETQERLKDVSVLVLESTFDEIEPPEARQWPNFHAQAAIDFWKKTGIPKCYLTHLACHSFINGLVVAGFSDEKRKELEQAYSGLVFAHDKMRFQLA